MKKREIKEEKIKPVETKTVLPAPARLFFHLFDKLLFRVVFILVIITCAGAGSWVLKNRITRINTIKNSKLITAQLRNSQELTVLKYGYSEIVSIKKTRIAGLAKAFSIVRYSGVIRAGIEDISKAEISVSGSKKNVKIQLPECSIISNEISHMEVFDEVKSIFIPISTQELFDLINQNRTEKEIQLIESGILDEARNRAIMLTENLLYALGFSDITVE